MNMENQLFLSDASSHTKETREAYQWFDQMIHIYSGREELLKQTIPMVIKGDKSLHQFMQQFFRGTDVNISDYVACSSEKEMKIETIHHIEDEGKQMDYRLCLSDESKGVQWLFAIAPILKQVFETGEVICIDHFGTGLHPLLVKYLVSLFHDPEVNKANAQLIASTHVVGLLSPGVLSRDQIYFVEKDVKKEASELYSLDDFSYRKGEDYLRMYLQGRYGALPFID